MQFWSLDQLNAELEEHHVGTSLGAGATLSRRQVLTLSGAAALWLMLPSAVRAQQAEAAKGAQRDTLHSVMAEVHELAAKLVDQDTPNEDEYVELLSTLMRRMPLQERKPFYGWRENPKGWAMDTAYFSAPIVLFQIKMEPGGVIELHDHRHYNGVLMGISGEVEVSNYGVVTEERDGWKPASIRDATREKEFFIRETAKKVITPGLTSTLTRDRDNIHEVRGGTKGGILLDLFTYFNPQARSYELDVVDAKVDAKVHPQIRRVAWRSEG